MSKVIFTGVNGILNDQTPNIVPTMAWIQPKQAKLLNMLLLMTRSKLVLTCSIRKLCYCDQLPLRSLPAFFASHGIAAPEVDVVDEADVGKEQLIDYWLGDNPTTTSYVIFDHVPVASPYIVDVNPDIGLTAANVEKAMRILNPGN